MFPRRFFPSRFFASRFWPKVGAAAVFVPALGPTTVAGPSLAYSVRAALIYAIRRDPS